MKHTWLPASGTNAWPVISARGGGCIVAEEGLTALNPPRPRPCSGGTASPLEAEVATTGLGIVDRRTGTLYCTEKFWCHRRVMAAAALISAATSKTQCRSP